MALVLGTNCGFVSTAPTADPAGTTTSGFDTSARATKDTAPATSTTVTEIGVWIDNATEAANIDLGIYTHDSTNDRPNALIGSVTIAKGTTAGWKTSATNISITAGTIYWIAAQCDDTATATALDRALTGTRLSVNLTETSLPASWGAGNGETANQSYGIYAVWTAAAAGAEKINIGDAWKTVAAKKINIGDVWKSLAATKINIGDVWKVVT